MDKKKRKEISKKQIIISALIVIALVIAVIIFEKIVNNNEENINPKTSASGSSNSNINANTNIPAKYSPLSSEEISKVTSTILSSEFIKSVPQNEPISLTFFKFENGDRIWQDSFLIGNNQLLTSGNPGVSLTLHSKYISELNDNNLCDIIKQANKNGDLGFESRYSTFNLLIKYSGMLKYRNCFGF